jgi:TetR/AcrR family transcriptional regulator, cholesterol catabolism regulator
MPDRERTGPVTRAAAAPGKVPRKRGPKVDVEQTKRRKREIIEGAARLFDRVGYHGVNMSMIAKAAGVKKPTLYHYISSKDEILFGLHELFIGTLRKNTDERIAAGWPPLEILRGVVEDTFKLLHDFPGYVRAFFEHFRELSQKQRAEIGVKRDEFVALVIGIIEEAMEAGVINKANPRLTAHCLFGISNWAYQWYSPRKDPSPEEVAAECWKIFLRGLAPR